jgi:hypothetical protein
MSELLEPTYAAFRTCGHMAGCASDDPELREFLSKTVAGWIRSGYRVERIEAEEIRNGKYTFCRGKHGVPAPSPLPPQEQTA